MHKEIWVWALLWMSFPAFSQQQFYVSPQGKEQGKGTVQSPWRTFQRAVQGVREYRRANPDQPVEVLFADGTYYIDEPILFGEEDSGTSSAPVSYRAMPGAQPVFSGAIPLRQWKVVKDKKLLSLLPEGMADKVYVCKLPKYFDTHTVPVRVGAGSAMEVGAARADLFCNGVFQTLSKYPNDGFLRIHQVLSQPDEQHPEETVRFSCEEERISRWANEPEVYLGGYWKWDWSDEYQRVDQILSDTTFQLSPPYHSYGYRKDAPFWGVNLLCELDSISEYYIDREHGKIYWYPEQGSSIQSSDVGITHFSKPYMVDFKDCSYVTFEGITFRDGGTVGMRIEGGEGIKIASCRFLCFSESAIHIFGGESHRITGCLMKQFGERVIQIIAGNRKELVPANHEVDNNIIEDFSLTKRTYEPAVYFNGIGLTIRNNYFSNCPSSALRIDGNDVTISYNEFVNLVRESDDQGVIDMWKDLSYQGIKICNNYFQDIKGGTLHGSAAVRFDDMISGAEVTGNIFNRSGYRNFGAVQIHGGKDNYVANNLFYDCRAAVSFTPWSKEYWESVFSSSFLRKRHYQDVDISSAQYQERYPVLRDVHGHLNRNFISHNLIVNCTEPYLRENNNNELEANTFLPESSEPIEYFYREDVLSRFGLKPLERDKMGVKHNIWKNR